MVISKFISIPLLILIPLIVLIFESRDKDFTTPPSDTEVAKRVNEWRASKPFLLESTPALSATSTKSPSSSKPAQNTNTLKPPTSSFKISSPLQDFDLDLAPGINHFQGIDASILKAIIKRLNPKAHAELIYLANERILDSATDSSINDLHTAAAYISKNSRPLWNPEASLRVPLKVDIKVEAFHFEKAKALTKKIESAIFFGSGGTVEPIITVAKVPRVKGKRNNSITISGSAKQSPVFVHSIPDTVKMVEKALQSAVFKAVKEHSIPIKYTNKIGYTHYTRLTWLMLADTL